MGKLYTYENWKRFKSIHNSATPASQENIVAVGLALNLSYSQAMNYIRFFIVPDYIKPTNRRYTEEEDRLIVETVNKYSNNIYGAILKVYKELNRPFISIQYRYYNYLKNSSKVFFFLNKGGDTTRINGKNYSDDYKDWPEGVVIKYN